MNRVFLSFFTIWLLVMAGCQSNEAMINEGLNNSELVTERGESLQTNPTNTPLPEPTETLEPTEPPIPTPTRDPMGLSFGVKGHEMYNLKGGGPVVSLAWHPDSSLVAMGGVEKILIWELRTLKHASELVGHSNVILDLAWSPDGSALASLSLDETVRIWKSPDYVEFNSLDTGPVYSFDWSPDGQTLAVGTTEGDIQIWNPREPEMVKLWKNETIDQVIRIDWSPDGLRAATAHSSGVIKIWDMNSGEITHTLADSDASLVTDLAWAPDGSCLATSHQNGLVHLWDQKTMILVRTIEALEKGVTRIAWSPDSMILSTGGVQNSIPCWEAASGEWIRGVANNNNPVWSMSWSPNGNFLIVGTVQKPSGVPGTMGIGGATGFGLDLSNLKKTMWDPDAEAGIGILWIRQ